MSLHQRVVSIVNTICARGLLVLAAAVTLTTSTPVFAQGTGWPMEVLSWDLDRAYPGVAYEWRIAVRGGTYPYTFSLDDAPAAMTIEADRGVLHWTAPSVASAGHTVAVRVVDCAGEVLVHRYTIDVTTDGFVFVDPAGDDGAAGSLDRPWRTIGKAQASADDDIVYVRAGTYAAADWTIGGGNAHRWLAFPAERPTLDLGGGIVGMHRSQSVVFGFEIRNAGAKLFWAGGDLSDVIWRNNEMHGVSSTGANNPAFIFFEDGDARPIDGDVQYDRMVIQDNVFHDLRSDVDHGGSIICYNVQRLLYEDNEAYDIDGTGVSDKDDGFRNTIRNNVLHGCRNAIGLYSQYTQGEIEVLYNLVYDASGGVVVGSQPGYIRDVFIHHNSIVGASISFGAVTDDAPSGGFDVYRNLVSVGDGLPYELYPVGATGGYRYPGWVNDTAAARINDNLLWTVGPAIAGYGWGLENMTREVWAAHGYDTDSVFADPELTSSHALSPSSPYWGAYGRDGRGGCVDAPSPGEDGGVASSDGGTASDAGGASDGGGADGSSVSGSSGATGGCACSIPAQRTRGQRSRGAALGVLGGLGLLGLVGARRARRPRRHRA